MLEGDPGDKTVYGQKGELVDNIDQVGINCVSIFVDLDLFKVNRSIDDLTALQALGNSCIYDIAQPAKLVMKNVKFEFFGMQMYSLINIVYGDVELSNVEFHSIIILAYIYTPFWT